MIQQTENILAALKRREVQFLLKDPHSQDAQLRGFLSALESVGYRVVKPAVIHTDAPAQMKSCLRVAHYEIAAGHTELAQQKLDVALCLTQYLEDYLRELERMGTQVPITWAEWMQDQYTKRFANSGTSDNVTSNSRSGINETRLSEAEAGDPIVTAEGY